MFKAVENKRTKFNCYLADSIPDLICVTDLGMKYLYVNRWYQKATGYQPKELLGRSLLGFIHDGDQEKLKKVFNQLLEEGALFRLNIRYRHANGHYIYLEISGNLLLEEDEELQGIVFTARDITAREKKDLKLEFNKLKTNFFAKLSHEFKTPINVIFSTLQILDLNKERLIKLINQDKFEMYMVIIRQNVYRLLRLVNNLIDLTKIDSDSFVLNLQNVDIVKVVEGVTNISRRFVEERNRELIFDSGLTEKIIACDPYNIKRVIFNLISNSLKFTREGDWIKVSLLEESDHSVIISIKDSGIGMNSEKQEFIFDRFRQIDDSFTRNTEGSGIGLALVKSLVEMHQGKITVHSVPGEGSEFIIKLPARLLPLQENKENNYQPTPSHLIDMINLEFSDIYN